MTQLRRKLGKLAALVLFVGIVLSPLRAVAAMIPMLVADDAVTGPTVTMRMAAGGTVRSAPYRVPAYVYDNQPDVDGGGAKLLVAVGAGAVHVYDCLLEHADGREMHGEGAIDDAPAATTAAEGSTALATQELNVGVHAAERMAQRGITDDMINAALQKGTPFIDPKNGTVNYVLQGGMASGKDLLVGTNPLTGKITTAITGSDLVVPRFIPLEPPPGPPILLGPGGN